MKELIIGASGLIGRYLYRMSLNTGSEAAGTYYKNRRPGLIPLDFTDAEAVKRLIANMRPDVIYLPAAMPHVDWCERHPGDSAAINVKGPCNVISALTGTGIKLVYYSSDYVFDGENGPYTENDLPNPVNVYGLQKLEVEDEIIRKMTNYLILRVTVVYGWEYPVKNFAHRAINNLRCGHSVKVPADQMGNPTYVANLAEASRELALDRHTGIFNLAGAANVSRYEFAVALAGAFNLNPLLIIPVSTNEAGQAAKRPLRAGLIIDKAGKVLDMDMLSHTEGLLRMKNEERIYNEYLRS
jgi:dTDP-4-dehydrorhamnose reductase